MIRLFGLILSIDAILSLFLPKDRRFLWQLGRIVRLGIGLILIFGGLK